MAVVHRFSGTDTNYDWEDIETTNYEGTSAVGASKKVLIGAAEGAPHFVFRYFHLEPGGHSTLNDYHAHDHGVMILHGKARVTVEDKKYDLNPRDIVYIKGLEHHFLEAVGNEPLGFLCVIANKDLLARIGVKPI